MTGENKATGGTKPVDVKKPEPIKVDYYSLLGRLILERENIDRKINDVRVKIGIANMKG